MHRECDDCGRSAHSHVGQDRIYRKCDGENVCGVICGVQQCGSVRLLPASERACAKLVEKPTD